MEHRKCECCREKFLLKDMKDDLCVCCYNFIQKRKDKTISVLEEKLADSERKYEDRKQFCITEIRSLTEMINNLLEENNELKQQLAESNESHHKNIVELTKIATEKERKIEELKQQLAEKDKEIDGLKDNWNSICDYLGDCVVKYDKEDFNGIYGEILEKVNILKRYDYKRYQDKISFAVEQLEKVKEWVIRQLFIITKDCSNLEEAEAKGCNELREETIKEIDNQIKQLKEGK